jgi:hypothetical protein
VKKVLGTVVKIAGTLIAECQARDASYNFVLPHSSLHQPLQVPEATNGKGSAKVWRPCTPAMAAGLTDHVIGKASCLQSLYSPSQDWGVPADAGDESHLGGSSRGEQDMPRRMTHPDPRALEASPHLFACAWALRGSTTTQGLPPPRLSLPLAHSASMPVPARLAPGQGERTHDGLSHSGVDRVYRPRWGRCPPGDLPARHGLCQPSRAGRGAPASSERGVGHGAPAAWGGRAHRPGSRPPHGAERRGPPPRGRIGALASAAPAVGAISCSLDPEPGHSRAHRGRPPAGPVAVAPAYAPAARAPASPEAGLGPVGGAPSALRGGSRPEHAAVDQSREAVCPSRPPGVAQAGALALWCLAPEVADAQSRSARPAPHARAVLAPASRSW